MINRKTNFLGHEINRLIAGDNPFTGHSYIDPIITDKEMKEFCYDTRKLYELYFQLEEAGFDCMLPLADPVLVQVLKEYKRDGGKMKFIFQSYGAMLALPMARQLEALEPIGFYLSGSFVDYNFEKDKTQETFDTLKDFKENLGCPVGIGSHYPEVIAKADAEGWGQDFLVACLHNLRRGRVGEQSGFITGKTKFGVRFYMEDRQPMLDTIAKVKSPCIAFKIFAGGNMLLSEDKAQNDEAVKNCYREVYSQIKDTDIAAIGMFTKYTNQIADDMRLYHEVMDEYAK